MLHNYVIYLSDIYEGSEDGDRIKYLGIGEYLYSGKVPSLEKITMASIIECINKQPYMKIEDYDESFQLLLPKPILGLINDFEDNFIMYEFEKYIEPTIIYNYDGYS